MLYKITVGIIVIGIGLAGLRSYIAGVRYEGKTRIDGKTVLITGANTGIGKETAIDLARRGARIIIACRDLEKAKAAADLITNVTGSKDVTIKHLDLASLKSVRSFAEDINKNENKLDILINNAGIMNCPYSKTEDGYEMQFGVNHLGHFLLTNLLLDLLKKSAPSRIVTVSSLAHAYGGPMNIDDINSEKEYSEWGSYSRSKLANVLFSRELAKKLQGTDVSTYSLHPGAISTELTRHWKKSLLWKPLLFLGEYLIKTPEEGAQTTIYCTVEESLASETGKYYSDCAEKTPSKAALDDDTSKRLWELSEKMVGLYNEK